MNNPWYDRVNGAPAPQPRPQAPVINPEAMGAAQNAMQLFQTIRNPVAAAQAELRRRMPGIPNEIMNNPMQILEYMKQQMGMTNEDIQQAASMIPPGMR